jgi:hypothetical protein
VDNKPDLRGLSARDQLTGEGAPLPTRKHQMTITIEEMELLAGRAAAMRRRALEERGAAYGALDTFYAKYGDVDYSHTLCAEADALTDRCNALVMLLNTLERLEAAAFSMTTDLARLAATEATSLQP